MPGEVTLIWESSSVLLAGIIYFRIRANGSGNVSLSLKKSSH
jgi:hypothetical protein